MNPQEFRRLLAAYGADLDRWPEETRASASEHITEDPDASSLLAAHRTLDDALDRYRVATDTARMRTNLLEAVTGPDSRGNGNLLDRLLAWLLPSDPRYLWKPALAATLPLMVGLLVGGSIETASDYAYDSWDDEIALLALDAQSSVDEEASP